jgi:hypothetical protein
MEVNFMPFKFNMKNDDFKINGIPIWNNQGEGKTGIKADQVDGAHLNEIIPKAMYRTEITSSRGSVFKPGDTSTTLTATVYQGTQDITNTLADTQFRWTRSSDDYDGDQIWNQNHYTAGRSITITPDDVSSRATFTCNIYEL